jgi:hypothetical protein
MEGNYVITIGRQLGGAEKGNRTEACRIPWYLIL